MNFTLNEVKTAENIINGNTLFSKDKVSKDVMLLARYYKQRTNHTRSEIETMLLNYIASHKIEVTEYWRSLISHCLKNADKFQLSEIDSIPVTEMEISKIEELGDDNLERLAFTMLVLAKFAYEKARNSDKPNPDYWFFAQYKEILDKSNIKVGKDRHDRRAYGLNCIGELKRRGYIQTTKSCDSTGIKYLHVCEDEILYEVKDLRDLGDDYKRVPKTFRCVDCNKVVVRSSNRQCRCPSCQKKQDTLMSRERKRRQRKNNVTV